MPRTLWVLTAGQFINRFGSFVYPFLALYLSDHGYGMGQVATVIGALAVGNIAAPFASGYLADGIGRRNTIVISLVGGAITMLGLYFCQNQAQLIVMAVLHGFFANMFGPAANALMSDVVPPEKRVTAYAIFRLALNGGFAAGPAVAGFFYIRSPWLIFVGDALTTLIFAGLAYGLLPHGLRTIKGNLSSAKVAWQSWWAAGADLVRNRPFAQLLLANFLMSIAFAQIFNILSLDATARGLSPVDYGIVMGFNGLIIMLVELPLAQWIKRYPSKRILTWGYGLVGLGCASFFWADSLATFLVAMAIFTLGEMVSLPVSAAYGAELAPEEFRGRYFGFFGLSWGAAALVGSSGVWFYGLMGANWWLWTGIFGGLASVVMVTRVWSRKVVHVSPVTSEESPLP